MTDDDHAEPISGRGLTEPWMVEAQAALQDWSASRIGAISSTENVSPGGWFMEGWRQATDKMAARIRDLEQHQEYVDETRHLQAELSVAQRANDDHVKTVRRLKAKIGEFEQRQALLLGQREQLTSRTNGLEREVTEKQDTINNLHAELDRAISLHAGFAAEIERLRAEQQDNDVVAKLREFLGIEELEAHEAMRAGNPLAQWNVDMCRQWRAKLDQLVAQQPSGEQARQARVLSDEDVESVQRAVRQELALSREQRIAFAKGALHWGYAWNDPSGNLHQDIAESYVDSVAAIEQAEGERA